MNCQEFREQLEAALDQRRSVSNQTASAGDVHAVAHAESCVDCRVLYEEHVLIQTALAAWTPRRPVVDLADKVIEAARQEGLISSNGTIVADRAGTRPGARHSRQNPIAPITAGPAEGAPEFPYRRSTILATVTTILLVLMAAFIVFRDGRSQIAKDLQPDHQLFPDRQPERLDESPDQLADIGHLVADAQSAWRGLTSRVSHQASSLSVFVPDLKNELGISSAVSPFEMIPDDSNPDRDSAPRRTTSPSAVEKAFEFLFDDADSAGTRTI